MIRRYWVIGNQTPHWIEQVTRHLAEGYLRHGVVEWKVMATSSWGGDPLSVPRVVREDDRMLVLVPARVHEVIDVAQQLTWAGKWENADLAIVDCRPQDIRDIINILGDFPKWPIAWWPNIGRFQTHACELIDQLVLRQIQLLSHQIQLPVGAGIN